MFLQPKITYRCKSAYNLNLIKFAKNKICLYVDLIDFKYFQIICQFFSTQNLILCFIIITNIELKPAVYDVL